jgi:16S rRNA (guanine527-N7)-methyltransferase
MTTREEMLIRGLEGLGLPSQERTVLLLGRFADLLLRWNRTYNLTAIREESEVVTHHLLDSAALVPMIGKIAPEAQTLLDVGSGGGLPAVPTALLRPDLSVHAVDTVKKKVTFLQQAQIELGLKNFRAHHARVENLRLSPFDVITSRAFASLADFTSLTEHLLKPSGVWLAMKGVVPEEEMAALPDFVRVREILPMTVPGLHESRHLIVMERNERCGLS